MKKRFPSLILTMMMMFSLLSTTVFAADSGPRAVNADPGISPQRTYMAHDNVGSGFISSPADVVEDLEKLASVENNNVPILRASWTQLPGTYYVYAQTTKYNCGPATVQSVLRYLAGSTPSQDDVATGCKTTTTGTSLKNMVSYTNSMQDSNNYVVATINNQDDMDSRLYNGINNYGAPPMMGLAFASSDGWAYSTNGHAISVYAAMSDKSAYMITGPWIGYAGITSTASSYSRTSTQLYNALLGLAW